MTLVTIEDRGAIRIITYANPPFGTMTGAGASEMFGSVAAAASDAAVRVIVITGGVPGIFIRHYDVGELSNMADALENAPAPALPPGARPPGFHALTDAFARPRVARLLDSAAHSVSSRTSARG